METKLSSPLQFASVEIPFIAIFAFIFVQNTLAQEAKSGQDGNNFQVRLEPAKIPEKFTRATVPGVLQYACSPDRVPTRALSRQPHAR